MAKLADFRARLKIDRDDLDTELADQAELYHQVALQHVLAVSRRDEAKAILVDVEAKAAARLREEGRAITAATQEAKTTKAYKTAQDALRAADEVARKWEVLRESIRAKGYALRELVELEVARSVQADSAPTRTKAQRRRARHRV